MVYIDMRVFLGARRFSSLNVIDADQGGSLVASKRSQHARTKEEELLARLLLVEIACGKRKGPTIRRFPEGLGPPN